MEKYLIVVDMQNDFVTGSLGTKEAVSIVSNVKNKLLQCIKDGYKIFFTQDTHADNYMETHEGKFLPVKHCICDSDGWQIIPELKEIMPKISRDCMTLYKASFSVPTWDSYIYCRNKNVLVPEDFKGTVEIVGVCTDICVISNALTLRSQLPNAEIIVHADCCAGTTPERHKAALEVMKSCHITVKGE